MFPPNKYVKANPAIFHNPYTRFLTMIPKQNLIKSVEEPLKQEKNPLNTCWIKERPMQRGQLADVSSAAT